MSSHLRQTHVFKKYLSWLCPIFDFPASSLTWGNVTLKKKKKAIYLQNMCIILLTFFSTQTSLMFNMMWLPQQLELWVHDEYTLTSQWGTQLWLCWVFTNNRFPLQSGKAEHTQRSKHATAPNSGKQTPRGLCCWSTQKQNQQREREEESHVPKV